MKDAGIVDFNVKTVELGIGTRFERDRLILDLGELKALLEEDRRIEHGSAYLIQPGDDVRLVHVLDVVQPAARLNSEQGGAFPGILSAPGQVGRGSVLRVSGVNVTLLGVIPAVDSFFTQQEGILDMGSDTADLSPLSREPHIVLELEADTDIEPMSAAEAYRNAALRIADYIGRRAADQFDAGENISQSILTDDSKPSVRVIHICEVSAFGSLFDTIVVGRSAMDMLPTLVSPQAMAAGAIVSADYHYAGQRNYTRFYQSNPVQNATAEFDLAGVEFLGTVILPVGGNNTKKQTGAAFAAHLAEHCGAQGAVVTAVAGGNAHLDAMFAVRECEQRGISAVLSIVEMAGRTGADPGMVDTVPEADLIVSTGNREASSVLPRRGSVLGGLNLLDGPDDEGGGANAAGELCVPLRTIVASNNEMGAWRIGAISS